MLPEARIVLRNNRIQLSGTSKFFRINHDQVITPNLLNHLTFGWNKRDIIEYFPQRYEQIPEADRAIIAIKGASTTSGTGNRMPPPAYNIGDGYNSFGFWIDTLSPSRTWQINEQLAWIHNKHNIKFGFTFLRQDYRRVDCNGCVGQADFSALTTGLPGASGQTGSSYAAFLLGLPAGGFYHFPGAFSFGQPYPAWFVQDDWKISKRFFLSLGMRHEFQTHLQDRLNFAPRFSFAWSADKAGKSLHTYQPMYPNTQYYVPNNEFAPTNFYDIAPRLGLDKVRTRFI